MKPLLVLLAGAALAAGPAAQASAEAAAQVPARPGVSGDGATSLPEWADTLPAPPPPEVALRASRLSAARVRAVILTVAEGEQAEPPARSVFLNCSPVGGSHPSAEEACAWLNRAGVDPGALRVNAAEPCTMIYAPVTVTASGIWDGKYFQFRRTFGNDCELKSAAGALFDF